MNIYYLLTMVLTGIGMFVSNKLKSKFNQYKQIGIRAGLSGREVAQQMLDHYNLPDVKIVQGKGFLSDHYNPMSKTVSLSPDVYSGKSIAAAAVAAHECGHAVQHATKYNMLQVRSALVPYVKFASAAQGMLLIAALSMVNQFPMLLLVVIAAFGTTAAFSLITLPVEFDASKRALVWLDETGITEGAEYDGARDALKWAALTYVAGALSSLVMVLYFIFIYMSQSRRR